MPSTTFLEEEDKALVQLAGEYVLHGSGRIVWKDVARKMKRWKRSREELAQRVNSLKRMFGTDLAKFPPSFYTLVHASRGRRSAQVVLIRQTRKPPSSQNQPDKPQSQRDEAIQPSRQHAVLALAAKKKPKKTDRYMQHPSARSEGLGLGVRQGLNAVGPKCVHDGGIDKASACSPSVEVEVASEQPQTTVAAPIVTSLGPERETLMRIRSSQAFSAPHHVGSAVHEAVSTMFEGVSRQEVVYPPGSPHLNVGELLPTGVSALVKAIDQIGVIKCGDVFMDIGSGVGNVVAQFALSTSVRASVGTTRPG